MSDNRSNATQMIAACKLQAHDAVMEESAACGNAIPFPTMAELATAHALMFPAVQSDPGAPLSDTAKASLSLFLLAFLAGFGTFAVLMLTA